jgi:hypothetical protein
MKHCPIHNPDEFYYTEDNATPSGIRSLIMHFDSQLNMELSTLFANITDNFTHCASADGALVFIVRHAVKVSSGTGICANYAAALKR